MGKAFCLEHHHDGTVSIIAEAKGDYVGGLKGNQGKTTSGRESTREWVPRYVPDIPIFTANHQKTQKTAIKKLVEAA